MNALLPCLAILFLASVASAQSDKEKYLQQEPLASVNVQNINNVAGETYSQPNNIVMYQPEQENDLSFYARTQDGEWLVPAQVDRDNPWVRVLVLSNPQPALIDIAIEINHKPFRLAREEWIDQLQTKSKAVSVVRSGSAIAGKIFTEARKAAREKSAKRSEVQPDNPGGEAVGEALEAEKVPMTEAKSRAEQTASRQLINYLAANHSTIDREEVRWLLAERAGGPTLLTLGAASCWKRANVTPLLDTIDLDGDRSLSQAEISDASITLEQADINRDEHVDLAELKLVSKRRVTKVQRNSYPLVVVIDEHCDWKSLLKHIRKVYSKGTASSAQAPLLQRISSGDPKLTASDLVDLCSSPSQIVCEVKLGQSSPGISLHSTDCAEHGPWKYVSASKQVITLEQQPAYLELTVAQSKSSLGYLSQDIQQTQIAIGAAVDGYPLFRLLDRDNNQKLSLREWRRLGDLLTRLDLNRDQRIEPNEIPTAFRLAVTLGPQVHRHLSTPTAAQRDPPQANEPQVPAWFAGMDVNRDGDISRREFRGTSAQFANYDTDNDGLISKKEVQ